MLTPPFKRNPAGLVPQRSSQPGLAPVWCDHDGAGRTGIEPIAQRTKLHQLDPHLHCSVLGTCMNTAELRKLMAKHVHVQGESDLDIHHTAVSLAAKGGDVSKALHKALDQRHASALHTFSAAKDEAGLQAAWNQAWQQGEIPGAYWALLTHKAVTPDLRQTAFGAVHMLSHLMGSAHRQEIQRFVALERQSADLQDRLEREQVRRHELVQERDQLTERLHQRALDHEAERARLRAQHAQAMAPAQDLRLIALQTERREQAERTAQHASLQVEAMQRQLERLQAHAQTLSEELGAAEAELQRLSVAQAATAPHGQLEGLTLLYVGGRPSAMPAIRDYVTRQGGELMHHDGGLESRKGLLAAQLPRADLVVFPVDCIDHDSALNLKRLCERHQRAFIALRSAGLASLAAALQRREEPSNGKPEPRICLRHG